MSVEVLVVDDNPMMRDVVRMMLESRGYTVTTANDGHEALRKFPERQPDVALVDVDMPGLDGVEVCQALKLAAQESRREGPVWLMTGVERVGIQERAHEAGALGVIPKPFTSDELAARLAQCFRQPAIRAGAAQPV